MAKKKSKKNSQAQQPMSSERFLKEKARGLEIGKCYVSDDIKNYGEGHVVVTRQHIGGKISAAFFLIDAYCVGVKDSFYRLRMDEYEFELIFDKLRGTELHECSYEEAHNWIWGAVAFAEEAGINPDKSFNLTQYMLEEDTDEVPLIEYEFGRNGKHFLVAQSKLEASRYLPAMKAHLGDNFDVTIKEWGHLDDDDDFEEEDDDDDDRPHKRQETQYSYQHPSYPQSLQVENQWVATELCDPKNASYLDDQLTDRILALPHDSLRRDLENLILYYTGQSCNELPDEDSENFNGVIGTSTMLLAEVGNEDCSLDVVLEVLRQSPDFYDFHIADSGEEIFVPTLYKLGQHKLDKLMDFMKEEGLYSFSKVHVFSALNQIAIRQPERRSEVVEWYRHIIQFTLETKHRIQILDNTLLAMMIGGLVDFQAQELQEDVYTLYKAGYVDKSYCGGYEIWKKDLQHPEESLYDHCILDIHERFHQLKQQFSK